MIVVLDTGPLGVITSPNQIARETRAMQTSQCGTTAKNPSDATSSAAACMIPVQGVIQQRRHCATLSSEVMKP